MVHSPFLVPALSGVSYSAALAVFMIDPMLARIVAELDVDPRSAALATTVFALPYALAQPFVGVLADQLGHGRVMLASLGAVVAANAAGAVAPSFEWLLVSRFLAGLFTAGAATLCFAVAAELLPEERRQIVFGRISAAGVAGSLSGAVASGLIADLVHWRMAFLFTALVGALALPGGLLVLRPDRRSLPVRFTPAEVAARYVFLWRNGALRRCCAAQMVLTGVMMGLFPHLSFIVASDGETRSFVVSTVLSGFMIGSIVYGVSAAVIVNSLGRTGAMRAGGGVVAVMLVAFAASSSPSAQFAILAVAGLGYRAVQNPLHTFAASAEPSLRGSALALYGMLSVLGQSAAPLVYGQGFALLGTTATLGIGSLVFILVAILASRRSESHPRA